MAGNEGSFELIFYWLIAVGMAVGMAVNKAVNRAITKAVNTVFYLRINTVDAAAGSAAEDL